MNERNDRALTGKTIAILATEGFEQVELDSPKATLSRRGATIHVIAPEEGTIRGWDEDDWGDEVVVDVRLADADADIYDALVLPGGLFNPDSLRRNEDALDFVRAMHDRKVPIAAICHAPWILIDAGLVKGKTMTSYPTVRTDLENAGAEWRDEEAVCDGQLITSRSPEDLEAFNDALTEALTEGRVRKAS